MGLAGRGVGIPMSALLLIWVGGAVSAWALTGVVLSHAGRRLLDVPNERSSHAVPTPRGGGLAIALVVSAGLLALALVGALDSRTATSLLAAGGAVAWIGWLDDRNGVGPGVRFGVHVAAISLLLVGTTGLGPLAMPALPPVPVLHYVAAAFALAWLINLFNFMDGIDGIAGAEAVFFAIGLGLCLRVNGVEAGVAMPLAALIGGLDTGLSGLELAPGPDLHG